MRFPLGDVAFEQVPQRDGSVLLRPGVADAVTVQDLAGNQRLIWSAESGGSSSATVSSDSEGDLNGWVDMPDFDIVYADGTRKQVRLSAPGWFNVMSYGAVGDGTTDDYQAFVAAHAALPANGGIVFIPPGSYAMSATWNITKTCVIQGAGGGANIGGATPEAATIIKPASGVTGMRLYSASAPTNPPVVLRDFVLISRSSGAGTDDGIQVQTHGCVLDHITCTKFGRYGISVDTGGPTGNANNSHFRACRTTLCQSHGFYINGVNSQAMLFEACDASSNLGWGFYSNGSATNTFLRCHSATNTLGSVYDVGSSNQYIGHYTEAGTGNNVTFDTGSNGNYWLNPGSYSAPPITDNGSHNLILTADSSTNVPTWSQLTTTGSVIMTGGAGLVQQRALNASSSIGYANKVTGDANDRLVIRPDGIRLGDGTAAPGSTLSYVQANVFKLSNALQLASIAAGSVPNNTLFIDSADNKLKFKDSGGVVNLLY